MSWEIPRKLTAILTIDGGLFAAHGRGRGRHRQGRARAARGGDPVSCARSADGWSRRWATDLCSNFPRSSRSVECAILIQKAMSKRNAALPEEKRFLYRMGVNVGDVLVEEDDILGDGVNVAARLEGICEPGGICMSGSAHEHLHGRIGAAFDDLGEQRLKNIDRPVRAYALSPGSIAVSKSSPPRRRWPTSICRPRLSAASRRGFPLSSCLSQTLAAIRRRTISPTASQRA